MATLTTHTKAMKVFYGPRMAEAILDNVYFLKTVKDKSKQIKMGGKDATLVFPVHTKKNWGVGAGTEDGVTGTPADHGFDQYSVTVADLDVNFKISHKLVTTSQARPDLSYVGDALEYEMSQVMKTAEKWLAIEIHGDGTGALCQIDTGQGAATGTTFYVDNPGPARLEVGMIVGTYTNKTTGSSQQLTNGFTEITDINPATGLVTVGDATGATNNHYVYLKGTYGATHMNGLDGIVDDGTVQSTFQGIVRSGKRYSQAHMIDASNRPINEQEVLSVMRRLLVYAPSAADTADVIMTDPETQESFALTVLDRQRFSGTDIEGGFAGVNFSTPYGKKKIIFDPLSTVHQMVFLRMADFAQAWLGKRGGDWLDEEGRVIRLLANSSSGTGVQKTYVGTWQMYPQIVCENPLNQARLSGFTV